jgi:hypothetical protein
VSGYEGKCPSCGAPVVFQLGSTLLRVCEHCGSAVARKGADLASYGKVAGLIPTPSVLKLGLDGDYAGAPPFQLVGHLQLAWAQGTWDEWLMAFQGGSWAWLSESQGRFHYMGQTALPPVPDFDDLRVGQTVDLGPPGTFVVAELRRARFASAEGELPFDVAPGSELRYADLSGPGGQFATLDYGTANQAESLYVGREVTLAEMQFRGLPDVEERRKKVGGEGLKCPQCAGPLEVRAPDQTQRIACPFCGSLLDATKDFKILEVLSRPPIEPLIPLGSKGTFEGVEWTVIGVMERSVTFEGTRYPWTEYLLYEAARGFRWLVESKGHWSYVEPLNPGDVRQAGPTYRDVTYSHFQGGIADVDHVLGEFYWAVATGDRTESDDYVKAPSMLSREKVLDADGNVSEITWSHGTYTPGEDVWRAFHLEGSPPEARGVAPHQPSPYGDSVSGVWAKALMAMGAVFLVFVLMNLVGSRRVVQDTVRVPVGTAPGSPEAATFLGPFDVPTNGNLQVKINAPVSNSWLYLSGALINEATGALDDFDLEVSYYYGRDSDGSWSEGGTTATQYIATVPAGRYSMRLEPQWEPGRQPPDYTVSVRSRVPRFYHVILAWLALLAWPAFVSWRWFRFEAERWSESDHPWIESSEDDE